MEAADRVTLARHFDVGAVAIDAPYRSLALFAADLNIQNHADDDPVLLSADEMKMDARLQLLLAVHDHLHAKTLPQPDAMRHSHRDSAGDLHHLQLVFQRVCPPIPNSEPLENYPPQRRQRVSAMAEHVAAIGELWLAHLDPAALARDLRAVGFTEQEDLGPHEMAFRFYRVPRSEAPTGAGPRVIRPRPPAGRCYESIPASIPDLRPK